MELLSNPQAWLSFLVLAGLETVLGIDNIIFLVLLVNRLPPRQRHSARLLGLSFAMLTRIGLLLSITWLATLRRPLFTLMSQPVSGRDLILFAGGAFLAVKSALEIRDTLRHEASAPPPPPRGGFWLVVAQIGIIDIAFSLDSVFTAVGLAKQIEVMIAAIVASVVVMMIISRRIGDFIERYPTIKILALAFLVLVGAALIGQSLQHEIPQGYLYFAMAFSAAVEWLNLRLRGAVGIERDNGKTRPPP